jgi:homogentisate 1,2-dioxygenase
MVSFPQSKGIVARQAQAAIPKGTHEEQYSRHGFAGDQAMLYRAHASIGWTRIEGTFRNLAADTSEMDLPDMTDPRALPTKMMFNDDVAIFVSRRSEPMPYYFRDVEGDEVILVQRGHGQLRTDFGALAYSSHLRFDADPAQVPRGPAIVPGPFGDDQLEHGFVVAVVLSEVAERIV